MALIKCSECGKQISDKAKTCPSCGYSPEVQPIESTEKVTKVMGDGRIVITVAMDIEPFFKEGKKNKRLDIESQFYRIRNSGEYKKLIDKFKKISIDYCKYDRGERELEKIGYDTGTFRGIIYNDFFAPTLNITKAKLIDLLEKEKEKLKDTMGKSSETLLTIVHKFILEIYKGILKKLFKKRKEQLKDKTEKSSEELRTIVHILIIDRVIEIINDCKTIKIKLSYGGIAYVVIEKIVSSRLGMTEIKRYNEEARKIIATPYDDDEIKEKINEIKVSLGFLKDVSNVDIGNLLSQLKVEKTEQVFNLFLWALSIYTIHFFLKELKIGEKIAKFLKKAKLDEDFLKHPRNVKYGERSFTKSSPPTRNYLVAYHLPNNIALVDKNGNEIVNMNKHLDCTYTLDECLRRKNNEACFIECCGHEFLPLLEQSFNKKEGDEFVSPEFRLSKIRGILDMDLSSWKKEMCLIESEAVIICNPNDDIRLGGRCLKYDEYWKCIIKGFGFITGGKTFAQIIHRMLIEGTEKYRGLEIEKRGVVENVEKKIAIISNLLSRDRIALSPSMISRAAYARRKFKRFIAVTGLDDLLITIEISFNELNDAVKHFADVKISRKLTNIQIAIGVVGVLITVYLAMIKYGYDFTKIIY